MCYYAAQPFVLLLHLSETAAYFKKGGLYLLLSLQNRVSPKSEARINLVLSLETQVWTADYKLRKALSKK